MSLPGRRGHQPQTFGDVRGEAGDSTPSPSRRTSLNLLPLRLLSFCPSLPLFPRTGGPTPKLLEPPSHPQRSSWASWDLWHQAGGHVLYSLGLGMGTTINISSYKAGSNNYVLAVLCVAVVNLVISLVATSIIFTVLGFWISTSGHACVKK